MKQFNNKLSYSIYFVMPIVLFSCRKHEKKSELKYEEAIVIAKQHESIKGLGHLNSFNASFEIEAAENFHGRYNCKVVLECEHGLIYVVDDINIYRKLKEGELVKVDYYQLLDKNNRVRGFEVAHINRIPNKDDSTWGKGYKPK